MDERLHILFRRRSIRKYLDQPVEPENIDLLLQAGMAAPSAMNNQPWEFVVITDPEPLQHLRNSLPFGKFHAPVAIIVCGSQIASKNPASWIFWQQDCSAATENILIAAGQLGLGACWIGIHPIPGLRKLVTKTAKLPLLVTPLCIIYLGYPEFEKNPRTQYDAGRIHWQTYGNRPQLENKA